MTTRWTFRKKSVDGSTVFMAGPHDCGGFNFHIGPTRALSRVHESLILDRTEVHDLLEALGQWLLAVEGPDPVPEKQGDISGTDETQRD